MIDTWSKYADDDTQLRRTETKDPYPHMATAAEAQRRPELAAEFARHLRPGFRRRVSIVPSLLDFQRREHASKLKEKNQRAKAA